MLVINFHCIIPIYWVGTNGNGVWVALFKYYYGAPVKPPASTEYAYNMY